MPSHVTETPAAIGDAAAAHFNRSFAFDADCRSVQDALCTGAARGARRLAQLECPVKIMAGGVTGKLDDGFPLVSGT